MQILVHAARVVGGAGRLLEDERRTVHGETEQLVVGSLVVVMASREMVVAVGRWRLRGMVLGCVVSLGGILGSRAEKAEHGRLEEGLVGTG